MTGQGNRQFESIKRGKASKGMLDVSKKYKTRAGHAVRNLQIEKTNKTVIDESRANIGSLS